MSDFKVVIGANFGDEGKGLMTDYFCHESLKKGRSCCVVLSNGGAQRGHTVETPDGERHVFHHFGSGTLAGDIPTYISSEYIVNPMIFKQEAEELGTATPVTYVSPDCYITTPWDMMANQLIEQSRGENRHGSCGMGVWETILRSALVFYNLSHYHNASAIRKIRDYYERYLLSQYGINIKKCDYTDLFYDRHIEDHFIDDVHFMMNKTIMVNDPRILQGFSNIIIENAQGLLLDSGNLEYYPNVTASKTGVIIPDNIIEFIGNTNEIEVCYVSRTYMTRHGAGRFDTECSMDDRIEPDLTNVWNEHQGAFRYGYLDVDDMVARCTADFRKLSKPARMSIAFTHANEYELDKYPSATRYVSDGRTRDSITQVGGRE